MFLALELSKGRAKIPDPRVTVIRGTTSSDSMNPIRVSLEFLRQVCRYCAAIALLMLRALLVRE